MSESHEDIDFGEPNPYILPPLDAALHTLRKADPDPKDVEKLAAETILKRDKPHTFNSIFVRGVSPMSGMVICNLCGMSTLENQPVVHLASHPATLHVDWHNAMHRAGVTLG